MSNLSFYAIMIVSTKRQGDKYMRYLFFIIGGYLLGSANTACLVGQAHGYDPREYGTKNGGATNMGYIFGAKTGIIIALIDVLKAFLLIHLARLFSANAPYLDLLSGLACVLGHIFPIFFDFHGGKGLAALAGTILGTDPYLFVILAIIALGLMYITHYGVAAATSACILFPVLLQLRTGDWLCFLMTMAVSLVMLYKHIPNFKRISEGSEVRFFTKDEAE